MLAERIVSLSWRLKRAEYFQNAVINALIENGMHDCVPNWNLDEQRRARMEAAETGNLDNVLGIAINKDFANTRTLDQLLSYERRIENNFYRAAAEFRKAKLSRLEEEKAASNHDIFTEVREQLQEYRKETSRFFNRCMYGKDEVPAIDNKASSQKTEENETKNENNFAEQSQIKQEYRTQDTGHRMEKQNQFIANDQILTANDDKAAKQSQIQTG